MARRKGLTAWAGAAVGVGAGLVAQRAAINRRRGRDPEAHEDFGSRRGERSKIISLPDGAHVFIEEIGPARSKKAALFIHGSALRTDVWHYQMTELTGRRLVFCDLRGHGQSELRGEAAYSMETLSDDLAAVLDDIGAKELVIVGHSIGGMIALELCKRRPELLDTPIKGLVLVNTTYGPVTETLIGGGVGLARLERVARRPIDALGRQSTRIERLRRLIKPSDLAFWAVAIMGLGPKASAKQIDFVFEMLSETPADVIFDLLRSYRDFDMTHHLGDVTVPTLVIGGTHDRITVPQASEHLAEHLPKAELKIFEDCGHMVMLERHDEFNAMLERFLKDTLGPATARRR